MMKKVLLTGADGFIGRHTIPFLIEKEYIVHAVFYNKKPETDKKENLFCYHNNLLDLEEQKQLVAEIKPTHLLHFAWYAVPGKYWNSLENFRWVQASIELFKNFAENGGQRAVAAGTCAEYDWNYGYCSEYITPLFPSTLYGACKHSLQEMLKHFAKQTNLSFAWGRIFFLYGPYEHPSRLVPYVVNSLLKGDIARCSHGNQIRDFLYVEDITSAFVALLESNVSGSVNIASGLPITLKDLIYKISCILDKKDLVRLGVISTSSDEPRLLIADVSRLTNEVGWAPEYDLEQGLEQTINWWATKFSMA